MALKRWASTHYCCKAGVLCGGEKKSNEQEALFERADSNHTTAALCACHQPCGSLH